MEQTKVGFGERWRDSRPTKTAVAWACGVTGGAARRIADGIREDAMVRRLAPMCVVRFKHDVKKDQKLKCLKETGSYEQADYVKKQGWATMPSEPEPDAMVADECVKLLLAMS